MKDVFDKERIKELKKVRKQIVMNAFVEGWKEYWTTNIDELDRKDQVFIVILMVANIIVSMIISRKIIGKIDNIVARIAASFGIDIALIGGSGLIYAIHKAMDANAQIDKIVTKPEED